MIGATAMDENVIEKVKLVVELLVNSRYDDIEKLTASRRLSAKEMRSAVENYGAKLVLPPKSCFDNLDIVRIRSSSIPQWSIRCDLWDDRGKSDLTLELTIRNDDGEFLVEVDDVHTL